MFVYALAGDVRRDSTRAERDYYDARHAYVTTYTCKLDLHPGLRSQTGTGADGWKRHEFHDSTLHAHDTNSPLHGTALYLYVYIFPFFLAFIVPSSFSVLLVLLLRFFEEGLYYWQGLSEAG